MGMAGNGNELSRAIREWEWFFKCVNFGNGKDLAGVGGIRNTETHSRTSLLCSFLWQTQLYEASPAIWDHTVLPATRHR